MNKALKMDLLLLRKRFSIRGTFNIISLFLLLSFVFIGIKLLILAIGHPLELYILILALILISPFSDISYAKIGASQQKMMTFFKAIPVDDIQNYFIRRKLTFFFLTLIYLFFPISLTTFPIFLFMLTIAAFYTFITTTIERYGKNMKKNTIKYGLKYAFFFFVLAYFRGLVPLNSILKQFSPIFLLILLLFFFTITAVNLKYIYQQKHTQITTKVFFKFIKNRDILLILRTNLMFDLLLIALFSLVILKGQQLNLSLLPFALLSSYITIYFHSLNAENKKVIYFFKANNLKKIRSEKIKSILKISLFYLLMMIVAGFFFKELNVFILSYLLSLVAFILPAFVIKINVEQKIGGKICTTKDIIKLTTASSILLVVFNFFVFVS